MLIAYHLGDHNGIDTIFRPSHWFLSRLSITSINTKKEASQLPLVINVSANTLLKNKEFHMSKAFY